MIRGPRSRRLGAWMLAASLAGCSGAPPSPPPVSSLLEVPRPTLESYEPAVREAIEGSREELDALVSANGPEAPENARAYGDLGLLYLAHDLPEPAAACLHNAWRLDPRSRVWPFHLGRLHQDAGRWEESLEPLEALHRQEPRDLATTVLLARALIGLGRFADAERTLRALPGPAASEPVARFELGRAAQAAGHLEAAVARYLEVVASRPDAGNVHYQLGLAYRALGREAEARAAMARVAGPRLRLEDPRLDQLAEAAAGVRVLNRLGNEAFLQGRFDRAIELFEAARAAAPEDSTARLGLAAALARLGRDDEAENELRRALEIAPEAGLGHFNLGTLLGRQNRWEEARASLQRALALRPDDPDVRFNLANLLRRSGELDAAAVQYTAAIELDPAASRARYGLALVSFLLGRWQVGVDTLEGSLRLAPHEYPPQSLLARARATATDPAVRRPEEALRLARELFSLQPTVDHAETLVVALAADGAWTEALALLDQTEAAVGAAGPSATAARLVAARRDLEAGRIPTSLVPWHTDVDASN